MTDGGTVSRLQHACDGGGLFSESAGRTVKDRRAVMHRSRVLLLAALAVALVIVASTIPVSRRSVAGLTAPHAPIAKRPAWPAWAHPAPVSVELSAQQSAPAVHP